MNEARRVLSFIFRGRQYGYRLYFFEMIFFHETFGGQIP